MTNNNLYVSLEELEKLVEKYSYSVVMNLGLRNEIKSLQAIDLGKIDEMIEEHNNKKLQSLNESFQSYSSGRIDGLQELKSRLFPKQ